MDRVRWTHEVNEAARPTAAELKRSPEAITAQAAVESGWGSAAIGNNLFGIRDQPNDEWNGPYVEITTTEQINGVWQVQHNQKFRRYDSMEESIADHFRFLQTNGRYAANGVFSAKTDEEYFKALKRAGYATADNYVSVLMGTLRAVQQILGMKPVPRQLLMEGDIGEDVKALQLKLASQTSRPSAFADGIFGRMTRSAVMGFQMSKGLDPDGIVGPATKAALGLI